MELSDRLKQLMSGRSKAVERAVDAVIGQVGRHSETLRRQAEVVKDKARSFDETRAGTPGAAPPAEGPSGDTSGPPVPPAPSPPVPPAPSPPAGSALRGDLVEDRPEPPAP